MHETLRFVITRFGVNEPQSSGLGHGGQALRSCHGATAQMLVCSLVTRDSLEQLARLPDPHPGLSYPDALLVFLHRLGLTRADRKSAAIASLSALLDLSTPTLRAELLSTLASDADGVANQTPSGDGAAHLH